MRGPTGVIFVASISSPMRSLAKKAGVLTFRDVGFKSVLPVDLLSSQIVFLVIEPSDESGLRRRTLCSALAKCTRMDLDEGGGKGP